MNWDWGVWPCSRCGHLWISFGCLLINLVQFLWRCCGFHFLPGFDRESVPVLLGHLIPCLDNLLHIVYHWYPYFMLAPRLRYLRILQQLIFISPIPSLEMLSYSFLNHFMIVLLTFSGTCEILQSSRWKQIMHCFPWIVLFPTHGTMNSFWSLPSWEFMKTYGSRVGLRPWYLAMHSGIPHLFASLLFVNWFLILINL